MLMKTLLPAALAHGPASCLPQLCNAADWEAAVPPQN